MALATKNSEAVGSASKGVGGGMSASSGTTSGGGGGGFGGGGSGFTSASPFMSGGVFKGSQEGAKTSKAASKGALGLTTGSTIYGNTAFGPAGGMATGYATRGGPVMHSRSLTGLPGSYGSWSNFNNPNGSPMFGNVGNMKVGAKNTGQALGYMNALNQLMAARQRGAQANGYGVSGRPAFGPRPQPGMLAPEVEQQQQGYNFYDALRSAIPPGTMAFGPFNPPATPPSSVAPFMGYDEGFRTVGQTGNFNPGQFGPSPNSFYGSPKLGTPNLGGNLANYAGNASGGGFFSGGLGSRPPGSGGSWSGAFK